MENFSRSLLEIILEWASIAYNWIKNFIKVVWGQIQSYWPKIKEFIKDWLIECAEVVIIDGRETLGKELLEKIKEKRPAEVANTDINGIVALSVTKDKKIAKVADLEAEAQQADQYDATVHQNNGVLRIRE